MCTKEHHEMVLGHQAAVARSKLCSAGTCDEMAAVSVPPERGSRGAVGARQETSAGCVDRFDSSISFGEESATHFDLKTGFSSLKIKGILASLKACGFCIKFACMVRSCRFLPLALGESTDCVQRPTKFH